MNVAKKTRVLVLMSGGLDSMLAAKVLSEQGIEVTPICFTSYFFGSKAAEKASKAIGLSLRAVDVSAAQLEVVKKPKHGRGGAMNPCIDCHLLMIKTAKEIMEKEGYDLIATGEVLEERPMSQNKRSMDLIEKESGLKGKLLRPLSAKLLPETEAEISGLVDRARLEGISGRSRARQFELAEIFGIAEIPQPSGGCILTEKDYGEKLASLEKINPDFDGNDARILRLGRVFFEDKLLIVVARDKNESEVLPGSAKKGDAVFLPENFPGPSVLIRNLGALSIEKEKLEELGKKYVIDYANKALDDARISSKYL